MKKSLVTLLAGILIGGARGYFIGPHKVEEVVLEKEIEKKLKLSLNQVEINVQNKIRLLCRNKG